MMMIIIIKIQIEVVYLKYIDNNNIMITLYFIFIKYAYINKLKVNLYISSLRQDIKYFIFRFFFLVLKFFENVSLDLINNK